jgi:uncharacterized protein with HEPN domain
VSKRDYKLYLEDIIESIDRIEKYISNMNYNNFSKSDITIDAVVRNFEIIGEASKQLPKKVKDKYRDVEWQAMIDFRNVIIHEYFGVSLKIMWDIIKNELPTLKRNLKRALNKGLT